MNGAQALTNLIKHCYADEGILEGMKALLQAGADPELAFSVEGESVNAWQAAREGLAMAFFQISRWGRSLAMPRSAAASPSSRPGRTIGR